MVEYGQIKECQKSGGKRNEIYRHDADLLFGFDKQEGKNPADRTGGAGRNLRDYRDDFHRNCHGEKSDGNACFHGEFKTD